MCGIVRWVPSKMEEGAESACDQTPADISTVLASIQVPYNALTLTVTNFNTASHSDPLASSTSPINSSRPTNDNFISSSVQWLANQAHTNLGRPKSLKAGFLNATSLKKHKFRQDLLNDPSYELFGVAESRPGVKLTWVGWSYKAKVLHSSNTTQRRKPLRPEYLLCAV